MSFQNKLISVTDEDFKEISRLVYTKFGINLTEKKKNLVNGRLQKILKKYSLNSFGEYLDLLKKENSDKLFSELIDQISTNHTYFFREYAHFEFLVKKALPEIEAYHKNKNSKDLRFWCAASSSGEEPYTIIIHLMEYFGKNYRSWDAGLLATDISEEILAKAQQGIYKKDILSKVPVELKKKYFVEHSDSFEVTPQLKKEVLFRKLNLVSSSFPLKGNFDIIFCRNVMIYFDKPTRTELVRKLYSQLRPGGYLIIGHSETLNGLETDFSFVESAVYQRRS